MFHIIYVFLFLYEKINSHLVKTGKNNCDFFLKKHFKIENKI